MIPDRQRSESRTLEIKNPQSPLILQSSSPWVMWLGRCLLRSLPRYSTLLWKSAWSSQLVCWEWEKARGQLCAIFDPFKFCSAHDRIPSLTCPRVAGPSPCFLPVGREDFCRGVSTEVLPCSHPAFGDTSEFCQARGLLPS